MTIVTVILVGAPDRPVAGFLDRSGKVRIGRPSLPEYCSRPLTADEIASISEAAK